MAVNSKKVDVTDLVKGMYVSKLDRPWIETSYPIEGFYLQTDQQLRQLNSLCRHVYIDVDLSRLRVDIQFLDLKNKQATAHEFQIQPAQLQQTKHLSKQPPVKKTTLKAEKPLYLERTAFEKELHTASTLYDRLNKTAAEVLSEISIGRAVNSNKIKHTAVAMVDSIIRNPDAFLWLSRLKAKDTHTHSRSIRSAIWAIVFGRYLSLPKAELNALCIAVLLANIGKARLPRHLLEKADTLTGDELKSFQKHINFSVQLLKEMGQFSLHIMEIVACHCERYDGSGYPRKLKGGQIIFPAQIAGLVTYYEEITNQREPEQSLDPAHAMDHLYQLRDRYFPSLLVEEFIQSIGIYPAGSLIELNSREIAVIVEQNENNRLLPKVMILRDASKQPVKTFKILDLYQINAHATHKPKIVNAITPGSYDIEAEEIIDCMKKVESNNLIKTLLT